MLLSFNVREVRPVRRERAEISLMAQSLRLSTRSFSSEATASRSACVRAAPEMARLSLSGSTLWPPMVSSPPSPPADWYCSSRAEASAPSCVSSQPESTLSAAGWSPSAAWQRARSTTASSVSSIRRAASSASMAAA